MENINKAKKSRKPFILTTVSLVIVFSLLVCCFVFPTAHADAGNSFGMPDRYSRESLVNNGWLYKDSSYYVYSPIMSDGRKFERVNMNSPGGNTSYGLWTIDNWGLGQYNSTTNFYTYSKRIFFADTTRHYTSDYNFATNFFVIPKNSSVRLTLVLHLTGQVQYYRDIYELCSISLYTNQNHTVSDRYISYNTGLKSQNYYYGTNTQVFTQTSMSEWAIQTTFTADTEDVYVNSIHLNMNALMWDPSILSLSDCGKMFESFLIIEYVDPEKDPIQTLKMNQLMDKIEKGLDGFMNGLRDLKEPIENVGKNFFEGINDVYNNSVLPNFVPTLNNVLSGVESTVSNIKTGFTNTVNKLNDGFENVVSALTGFPMWLDTISGNVVSGTGNFIKIVTTISNLDKEVENNGIDLSGYF